MALVLIALGFALFIGWIKLTTKIFLVVAKWSAAKYMMAMNGWVFGSILVTLLSVSVICGWRP